jgi:hypothetical protein
MVSFIRLNQRSSVLFPHPDGPMKALTRFFGMQCLKVAVPTVQGSAANADLGWIGWLDRIHVRL